MIYDIYYIKQYIIQYDILHIYDIVFHLYQGPKHRPALSPIDDIVPVEHYWSQGNNKKHIAKKSISKQKVFCNQC